MMDRALKGYAEISLALITYLNVSGSSESSRSPSTSACGYIRKPILGPEDPGRLTSWAKLQAIQFISQAPNSVLRAATTLGSSSASWPGGSSSTTLRTSAGSTGVQPNPLRKTSARQCCALLTISLAVPRLL